MPALDRVIDLFRYVLRQDVAGGYSASMLDAVRRTLDTSKILTVQHPEHETLTFEEVFRLATLGGSQGTIQSCILYSSC